MALEKVIPEKAYTQNIKLGMPVVTYGNNPSTGEFYVDQNVTMSAGWCNAAYGVDGWGSLPPFFGAMTLRTRLMRRSALVNVPSFSRKVEPGRKTWA